MRSFVPTGVAPLAFYERPTLGMAKSEAARWRSVFAEASGISTKGRCGITAVWLAFGLKMDPLISNTRSQIKLWLKTCAENADLRPRLRQAWRAAVAEVVSLNETGACREVRWGKVAGSLTSTIAMLTQAGWRADFADLL